MRIIAGSAKGRRLKSPKRGSEIKPILSRTRQSFFDTVRPRLTGCRFLDLYAGSGIVGLEALSRGADLAVFVERSREGLRLLEENIRALGAEGKAEVVAGDVVGGVLFSLKNRLPKDTVFEIVFSAPPYLGADRRGEILRMSVPTAAAVVSAGLAAPGGLIVLQHHKKEPLEGLPESLRVWKEAAFGETVLTYLEAKRPNV